MTGDLFIKQNDGTWLDCYTEWGVSLEDGALDALMGFRPNKEPVTNKNVTAKGAAYVTGAGLVDERTVNVPFHIVAKNEADFLLKRASFYEAIRNGLITLRVAHPVDVTYRFYYISCNQYTQYLDGLAKFVLSLYETNGDFDQDEAKIELPPKDVEEYISWVGEHYIDYMMFATEEEIRSIVTDYEE